MVKKTKNAIHSAQAAEPSPAKPKMEDRLLSDQMTKREKIQSARSLYSDSSEKQGVNQFWVYDVEMPKRAAILADFCTSAKQAGVSDSVQNKVLFLNEYLCETIRRPSMQDDQSSATNVFATTQKVDWESLLCGRKMAVEIIDSEAGGKDSGKYTLLNGLFGGRMGCDIDCKLDVQTRVPQTTYLVDHDQHADLPLPCAFLFGAKARKGEKNLEAVHNQTIEHRREFKATLSGVVGNVVDNHLKLPDMHHAAPDTSSKFRLLCVVWDTNTGKLMVVSEKKDASGKPAKPREFLEWANDTRHIKDMLSCNDDTLAMIKAEAERLGLVGKLLDPPRVPDKGYRPWQSTLERAKEIMCEECRESGRKESEAGYYKLANKIWGYAMLQYMSINIEKYQDSWADMQKVREVQTKRCSVGCCDGRHVVDASTMGALLTKGEFLQLARNNAEEISFVFHYGCGFLNGAQSIHKSFRLLEDVLGESFSRKLENGGKFSECERSFKYFSSLLESVANKNGAATSFKLMSEYLPAGVAKELKKVIKEYSLGEGEGQETHGHEGASRERMLAEFLYFTFLVNAENMRSIVRRALEVGALVLDDETGMPRMPAFDTVEQRLALLKEEEKKAITPKVFSSLVIEEVARNYADIYGKWNEELLAGGRRDISAMLTNFKTHQLTQIPALPTPQLPGQMRGWLLDFERKDVLLNDSDLISLKEVKKLQLEGKLTWNMAD